MWGSLFLDAFLHCLFTQCGHRPIHWRRLQMHNVTDAPCWLSKEPAAIPLTRESFCQLRARLDKLESQATAPLQEQVHSIRTQCSASARRCCFGVLGLEVVKTERAAMETCA